MASFSRIVNNYSQIPAAAGIALQTKENNRNLRGYSSIVNDTNELISKTKIHLKMIQTAKN